MRLVEFRRQVGQVRASRPGTCRIAGLRHEAGDDAMEDDAVIKPALHQRLDLRDMLWRPVGTQPDDHLAVLRRQNDGIVRVRRRPGGWSSEKRKRQRGATAENEHAGPRDAAAGSPARGDSRLKAHCNRRSMRAARDPPGGGSSVLAQRPRPRAISQPQKKVLEHGLAAGIVAPGQIEARSNS